MAPSMAPFFLNSSGSRSRTDCAVVRIIAPFFRRPSMRLLTAALLFAFAGCARPPAPARPSGSWGELRKPLPAAEHSSVKEYMDVWNLQAGETGGFPQQHGDQSHPSTPLVVAAIISPTHLT